ncbi:GNAT family N-acetyltransferase [Paenibacillus sp. P26]|nr:GNAT family N-acetyltransferase [Paenibacillus sp. P26]UUZ92709.1 GNAT family N-acetyltransferase [Paenibacillus sp. P25]
MFTIRTAITNDAEAIAGLMSELGYPASPESIALRMRKMEADLMYCTLVADFRGRVIGMIHLRTVYSYINDDVGAQVSTIVTKPEFRGQGVGKELMKHGENWAREQGAQGILLNSGIKKERDDAHRFYEKIGYKITGYRFAKRLTDS